jgi:hypothetical protein
MAAAGRAEGQKYTDLNRVDADFAFQGEYTGEIPADAEKLKLGVQVIAFGKGRFEAVAYVGGLPGDGWNKEPPVRAPGNLTDGTATFTGDKGRAAVKDGVLTIWGPDGKELGKLAKVVRQSPRWDRNRLRAPSCCSMVPRRVWRTGNPAASAKMVS